jgi:hypothetical protein
MLNSGGMVYVKATSVSHRLPAGKATEDATACTSVSAAAPVSDVPHSRVGVGDWVGARVGNWVGVGVGTACGGGTCAPTSASVANTASRAIFRWGSLRVLHRIPRIRRSACDTSRQATMANTLARAGAVVLDNDPDAVPERWFSTADERVELCGASFAAWLALRGVCSMAARR